MLSLNQIIDFVKNNLFFVIAGAVAFVIVVVLLVVMFRRPKRIREQQKFNAIAQAHEQRTMKKCVHCGSSIPADDELCMACNQMADGSKKGN